MSATWVLARREVVRFVRQPTRLFGSLAQPLMFWFFMGSGFSQSFSLPGEAMGYGEFFYPGIVLMLLLFAAIFSTITLIEDRTAGFLQGVLVAPVSRLSIVMGKITGGTAIALLQALLFLAFAPLAGITLSVVNVLQLVAACILIGLGFTGLGFMVAWFMDTVAGYHAVMSVVFIPLWLLSGALFPIEGAAPWLEWLMRFNPVTYAMITLRAAFYMGPEQLLADGVFLRALAITVGWSLLTTLVSVGVVRWRSDV
jgi:ABC-2 type transport system permease protein